ncbi:rod shape-determining protein MreD [Erythrobacter sp. F6033]|uniref:rod shape-determining protein MreD n=1 Tax=Erythrobacter sp. F6033 TaxID=2926401 RepID=UPI001FF2ABB4|nr:rod shape-determining protein MreD [Erythrobacter sp. F6033]MCK0128444.1 rod shape-determining protein MreD [Erythrobacter sp. F6033]
MRDRLRSPPQHSANRFGGGINRVQSPWRAQTIPYISITFASLLPVLLMADVMPVLPPLGFMMLIGWRIMRPGFLPLWVGVPLGAFDDLFSGQPFGSAILLWSIAMIVLEIIESRFPWRGFWQDWFTAGLALVLYIFLAMVVSGATLTLPMISAAVPQIVMAILLYPLLARLIARLDLFRLARARRVG